MPIKILHTSDWHLGKRLDKFSRLAEQKEVLQEICDIANSENVDAVLIAGDLFDAFNPPTEAVDLFYKTLKKLSNNGKRAVLAIAGNHDSPDRIEAPDPLARECGIIFEGNPNTIETPFTLESDLKLVRSDEGFIELKLPNSETPLRILLTPFANEYRLRTYLGHDDPEEELRQLLSQKWSELADKYCDDKGVNILLTHLYMMEKDGEYFEEPEDEKPILHIGGAQTIFSENIPSQIQFAALGHLHKWQEIAGGPCPAIYSGSPLAYSFSEADQDKYITIIEAEPGQEVTYKPVKLTGGKKLIRKKFDDIELAVKWLLENQNILLELTMVTDNYLTSTERKQLLDAHPGIVTIIPEVQNLQSLEDAQAKTIDLSKNIEDLFKDYFKHKLGQNPNERIVDLFKEILAVEEAE
jgi:DNA repair protein SbcD/Mre11